MRILKFILKVLAVIIIVFFLSGLLFSKISYTTNQRINLPLDQTFALFNDASKMKEWRGDLQSIKTIEEKPGIVGTRYQTVTADIVGTFIRMEELVTSYKENKKLSLRIESTDMIKKDNYTFQTVDNQTLIQNESITEGKTFLSRSLYASFYFLLKQQEQENLDSFKAYAENRAGK